MPPGSAGTNGPVPSSPRTGLATDGTRGSGSLFAMGLNYSLTGVFYNKQLAAQVGMTPRRKRWRTSTLCWARPRPRGFCPIMVWNATASGGGLAFPLQQLMAAYGPTQPINDWIFQKSGATIDTPSNLTAADHLQQWIKSGLLPEGRQRDPVHGRERALPRRRGSVHLQRRLGERDTTRAWRATSASSSSRRRPRAGRSPPCRPR